MCVCVCVCGQSLGHVCLSVALWTVTCQSPLSMKLFRQEHWSGLPFPIPGDLPDPGIKPASPALADGFSASATREARSGDAWCKIIIILGQNLGEVFQCSCSDMKKLYIIIAFSLNLQFLKQAELLQSHFDVIFTFIMIRSTAGI